MPASTGNCGHALPRGWNRDTACVTMSWLGPPQRQGRAAWPAWPCKKHCLDRVLCTRLLQCP
eukprot:9764190-Prorocentrum_lima.AAC.1